MEQELIDHIKSELGDLELDYREGAWENFREKKAKKEKFIFWQKLMGAAAILIIALLFIPQRTDHIEPERYLSANIPVMPKKDRPNDRIIVADLERDGHEPQVLKQIPYHAKSKTARVKTSINAQQPMAIPVDTNISSYNIAAIAVPIIKQPASGKTTEKNKRSINELLAQNAIGGEDRQRVLPPNNKWGFAVSVGNALDRRSKANLSLGTHISYAINNKVSVSSGVFYNQLGGIKEGMAPDMDARAGKVVTGSQASLGGVDIPLEIQVKANKQFYARVGISGYAIISQRQTLDFTEQKVAVTTYVDENGKLQSETLVTKELTTESVSQEKLKQNKFVGLYNLSVGFEQKITKHNSIAFEPYVKVPINGYSEQGLNLVQGGLRIKVAF